MISSALTRSLSSIAPNSTANTGVRNVKADSVECAINGTVVGTYPKSDLVGPGRLKSTDGVYGIRFSHNTDATVTGLTVVK